MNIQEFINNLKSIESSEVLNNQYLLESQSNNLNVYLNYLFLNKANILLIGEGAGYKGCFLTGIPFTSGNIIHTSSLFFPIKNRLSYSKIREQKENTSTIFYSWFDNHPDIWKRTVIWNAFPFHPKKHQYCIYHKESHTYSHSTNYIISNLT